jgi:hypothetical protein
MFVVGVKMSEKQRVDGVRPGVMGLLVCVLCCVWGGSVWAKGKPPKRTTQTKQAKQKKSKKPSSKKVLPVASLWQGVEDMFHIGTFWSGQMLSREARRPFPNIDEQLRIQWNAEAVVRLSRAYFHYLKQLQTHFPKHGATWKKLEARWRRLVTIGVHQRSAALDGDFNKKIAPALKKFLTKKWLVFGDKKALSLAQRKALRSYVLDLGTGVEILAYYRLRQLKGLLFSKKATLRAQGRAGLKQFDKWMRKAKGHLRRMMATTSKKARPRIGVYVYHAELGLRQSGRLRTMEKKPTKTKKTRYKKGLATWEASLRKANSSFGRLWRVAKSE